VPITHSTHHFLLIKTLGGSEKIARELFLDMDLNEDDIVTREEISQTLDDVLRKFHKEQQHDPSST
jgi:hypothetical protein